MPPFLDHSRFSPQALELAADFGPARDCCGNRLRSLDLDILIDLKGNARDRRTGILARRAVPVQVNYVGYPGTMGVPFIDLHQHGRKASVRPRA